jgi:hypothetical protein
MNSFQVSEERFTLTKSSAKKTIYSEIKSIFNIDWTTVTYNDLWKPLYSGLAAMLSIDYHYRNSNSPVDVESQARYWAQHYTINSWGSVNEAVNIYKQASSRIATSEYSRSKSSHLLQNLVYVLSISSQSLAYSQLVRRL